MEPNKTFVGGWRERSRVMTFSGIYNEERNWITHRHLCCCEGKQTNNRPPHVLDLHKEVARCVHTTNRLSSVLFKQQVVLIEPSRVLTVYLLVKTVRGIGHRVAVRVEAVRVFCLDGHSSHDGVGHQFVVQDHVWHFDVPVREPVRQHLLIGAEFHRFLRRGDKERRCVNEALLKHCGTTMARTCARKINAFGLYRSWHLLKAILIISSRAIETSSKETIYYQIQLIMRHGGVQFRWCLEDNVASPYPIIFPISLSLWLSSFPSFMAEQIYSNYIKWKFPSQLGMGKHMHRWCTYCTLPAHLSTYWKSCDLINGFAPAVLHRQSLIGRLSIERWCTSNA